MTNLKEQRIWIKLGKTTSETHEMSSTAFGDNTMRSLKRDESQRIRERRSTMYRLGDRWRLKTFRNIPANSTGEQTQSISPKFVPRLLTDEQKQHRLMMCPGRVGCSQKATKGHDISRSLDLL